MADCREKPKYAKALSTSILNEFGRAVKTSLPSHEEVTANSSLYNANVRIRNPPYVFPKTSLEDVFLQQISKYSIAPHLHRRQTGHPVKTGPSDSRTNRTIDYREFSRSLSACLFNGFNDPDSYRCSMNQAIHSSHVFAQQKLIHDKELQTWTDYLAKKEKSEKSPNVTSTSSRTAEVILQLSPVELLNCHRRRNDPMLKQEERIYNQDRLMKSLK